MPAYGASLNACSHRASAAAEAARMGTSRGSNDVEYALSRFADRIDERIRVGSGKRDEEGAHSVRKCLERSKMWRNRVERYAAAGRMESTKDPIFDFATAQKEGAAPSFEAD